MKALALLFVLLLAVVLAPRQRAGNHPPPGRSAPVRVVRSPQAAHGPKTVRKVRGKR